MCVWERLGNVWGRLGQCRSKCGKAVGFVFVVGDMACVEAHCIKIQGKDGFYP